MRKIILSLFLFLPCLLFAQANLIVVEGKVIDSYNKPIEDAIVQAVGKFDGTLTDNKGYYSFVAKWPATLKASIIGYKTIFQRIGYEPGKDTIRINFVLVNDSIELQQVEITGLPHEPELIKESGTLMSFETNQNKLWLLYHYRNGDHLELYDTGKNYITRMILKHRSEDINLTPYHYLYIENSDSVRLFDFNTVEKSIDRGGVTVKEFKGFMYHLVTYNSPYYYYLWTRRDNSAVVYWYFDHQTKKHKTLYSYGNLIWARQNDNILDKLAQDHTLISPSDLDNATAEETEVIPTRMSGSQAGVRAADSVWKESLFLKSLFMNISCPLRIVRDSIYIFNFDNDSIYVYNFNNTFIRQMPISFSLYRLQYNNQDILVNEEGDECYFKFESNGFVYLQKIDLNTGEKMNTQKLCSAFPEKIRLWNGYAFYSISDNNENGMFIRHLYRQKIN